MGSILPIDKMPNLKARLGKARTDRIRYVGKASSQRQLRSLNIPNTVRAQIQDLRVTDTHSPILDILQGVARLDEHNKKALSVSRLLTILQCVPIINVREVRKMLDVSDQNARKYVRALKVAFPYIENELGIAK